MKRTTGVLALMIALLIPGREATACPAVYCWGEVADRIPRALSVPEALGGDLCRGMQLARGSIQIEASAISASSLSEALECSPPLTRVLLLNATPEHLVALSGADASRTIRHLSIMGTSAALSPGSIQSLGTLPELVTLELSVVKTTEDVGEQTQPDLRAIESIVVEAPLDSRLLDALFHDGLIPRLTKVEVLALGPLESGKAVCKLLKGGVRLRRLAIAPGTARLECEDFNLPDAEEVWLAGLTHRGLRHFSSASLQNLERLGLRLPKGGGTEDVMAVTRTPWFRRLRRLELNGARLGRQDLAELLERASMVSTLSLSDSELPEDTLAVVSRSGVYARLETLDLRYNKGLKAPAPPYTVWPSLNFLFLPRLESQQDPLYRFGLCSLAIEC